MRSKTMYYPTQELCEQYVQERLQEAERERFIQQFKRGGNSARGASLFTKILVSLGELLVSSGLKLKHAAQYGIQL
jgi:hypothetical protein